MIRVSDKIVLEDGEIEESFIRSPGAGGQKSFSSKTFRRALLRELRSLVRMYSGRTDASSSRWSSTSYAAAMRLTAARCSRSWIWTSTVV